MNTRYYINKYDWTEAIAHQGGSFFDGNVVHDELLKCHEAYACDYGSEGEKNPFRLVTDADLKQMAKTVDAIEADIGPIDPVLECVVNFSAQVRHVLPRKTNTVDVQLPQKNAKSQAIAGVVSSLFDYCNTHTWGYDEPDMFVYLRRSRSVSRIAAKHPPMNVHTEPYRDGVQFYQSLTNPLQVAVRVDNRWFELGQEVDCIHAISYRPVSAKLGDWLFEVGSEFRCGWSDAKRLLLLASQLSCFGPEASLTFSDGQVQTVFDALCEVTADYKNDIDDALGSLELYRADSIKTAKTLRLAHMSRGHRHLESLMDEALAQTPSL